MISRQAWSDANFYRSHTGIRFIRQLWRRRCGMWMSTRYLDRKSRSPSEPGTEGNLRDHWMLIRFHHTSEWWDCTALATLASVSVWWRLYCRSLASLVFTLLLLISVSCSFVLVELGDQLVLSLTIGLLLYNVSALTVLDWLPSWIIINYYLPWLVTSDYCYLTCLLW